MNPLVSHFSFCFCFCLTLVLGALVLLLSRCYKYSSASTPPGSRGLILIGETLQFIGAANSGKGFYEFVRSHRLRYGNCFKTKLFGETQVFVSSIESAKAILNNDKGIFTKRYISSIGQLLGEKSILCASHDDHKLLRSKLINLFSTNSISATIKYFDELVVDALKGWETRENVVVFNETLQISLKAMCKIFMNLEGGNEVEKLQKDVSLVCEAMLAFPLRLPWTRFYKGLQARKRIMKVLESVISERRSPNRQDDEDIIAVSSVQTLKLTDSEIKDNILTIIIAGQDTTASALTWMVKYLSENQNVLKILKDEQLNLAKKTSTRAFLTLEDLNEMPYASKVIKESLRLASVVPWFPRLVLQDCKLEGYTIKKGWIVNIDTRSIHLDPSVYNEPDNFDPTRFDGEWKAYSFLAFGMGGRSCLGLNMAKAMMLVFLHRFVTTYRWSLLDSDSSVEKWTLFPRLKSGCPINVTREVEATVESSSE